MLNCKIVSSLEKVFSDAEPKFTEVKLSLLKGETASFQLAVLAGGEVRVSVSAPGFKTRVRRVIETPVALPVWYGLDDGDYLRTVPGLYPDLLRDIGFPGTVRCQGWWVAFWIDLEPEETLPGGQYFAEVTAELASGEEKFTASVPVSVVNAALPPQKIVHTEWFHCDCLADYYRVDAWSEEHWRIVENFVRSAVRMGINMILTPIFTQPLDTYVGGERTTVQLVDISVDSGVYSFNFDRLRRWVDMCRSCGIEYFEMAHLYSQWGARCAPKIMATVDGKYRRIFGWETPALGGAYGEFLSVFLPALAEKLRTWGIADRCRFHISDEPGGDVLPHYAACRDQAREFLPDFAFMDALSDFDFYEAGAVKHPVVASNSGHMQKFMDSDLEDLWIYYCCGQADRVSNRFLAMPSQRTRILGLQFYIYNFAGFLQWGFNFYNSCVSQYHINPYATADGDNTYPAGDPFIVYPGEDGQPEESLRYMAMRQGAHDLCALQKLESLAGREFTLELIRKEAGMDITLYDYPRNYEFLPRLRVRVNEEIAKRV